MTARKANQPRLTRESLLPPMAAYVLEHGMGVANLRPLAKAAGTSDRMLIYHFGNKERLIVELLAYIAKSYSEALDQSLSGKRSKTRIELLDRIGSHTANEEMESFLALWWEIVAGAARNLPGYKQAAQSVMAQLLSWLEAQMPEDDPDPQGGARYLLTMIEGAQMFSAIGCSDIGEAAFARIDL